MTGLQAARKVLNEHLAYANAGQGCDCGLCELAHRVIEDCRDCSLRRNEEASS